MPGAGEHEPASRNTASGAGGSVYQFGRVDGDVSFDRTPAPGALAGPLEALAREVRFRWEREERVHDLSPLPLRCRMAAEELAEYRPGPAERPDLTGELSRIADLHERVPSRRLVVLGEAGMGKSALCLRFVLDVLDRRRDTEAVPVLFALGSWDPAAVPLTGWLIERLARDYPQPGGPRVAADLVKAGLVLPVLDGFDEISDGLHARALRRISAHRMPLLLTSRRQQYAAAVEADKAMAAAEVVELEPLSPADVADQLRRGAKRIIVDGRAETNWEPVLRRLREAPDHSASRHLAAVLRTPLMFSLARRAYRVRDPVELLDARRFPTEEAVEEHLLGTVVPTAYDDDPERPPRWPPDRAERWLAHLAAHLRGLETHDLRWWRIAATTRRSSRALVMALVTGLVLFLVLTVVSGTAYSLLGMGLRAGALAGVLDGLLAGGVGGPLFGIAHGAALLTSRTPAEPSRVRLLLRARNDAERRSVRRIAVRTAVAALLGVACGIGLGLGRGALRAWTYGPGALPGAWVDALLFAIMFGTAATLVFGVIAALEAPIDIRSAATPAALLRANRETTLGLFLLCGPVFGLIVGVSGGVLRELLDGSLWGVPLDWNVLSTIHFATSSGLGGGIAAMLAFTAWGEWLVFGRFWLPLRGKVPWRTAAFLEDAHERNVLRQHGSAYQFRHARLRDHLARGHQRERGTSGRGPRRARTSPVRSRPAPS
ncbi:NACHT domain-containing protein [Saccharopolyspora sp. MS10]|uniref:NACHT domain-containing protein n=1 Tax=Saccharopolyspora sp. MS10 TaxID=3385973 RepID=UPI0039A0EAB0